MNAFSLLAQWDLDACRGCNRANRRRRLSRVFGAISRIGDGSIWYGLMLVLPFIYGQPGLLLAIVLAVNGLACTAMYKLLKHSTHRLRPCEADPQLTRTMAPLDRFSFPSGHTLHAVAFTSLTCAIHPEWTWALVPFTVLVAASRLVLGLHYPSDVMAGAAIGGGMSAAAFAVGAQAGAW